MASIWLQDDWGIPADVYASRIVAFSFAWLTTSSGVVLRQPQSIKLRVVERRTGRTPPRSRVPSVGYLG